MGHSDFLMAVAVMVTAFTIMRRPQWPDRTEVRDFVKAPHTRCVLRWLHGQDAYCIFPRGFTLQSSSKDLGDGTILGLVTQGTFQKALLTTTSGIDYDHLRAIIQETLLHYAQLVGPGGAPLGLGAWPDLLQRYEPGLRNLLSSSYPLVVDVLFPG